MDVYTYFRELLGVSKVTLQTMVVVFTCRVVNVLFGKLTTDIRSHKRALEA